VSPRRLRSTWLPNLTGGFVSFGIEALIVAIFVLAAIVWAALVLWLV